MRLSGADIEFINQIRGRKEPVYEMTNGKKMYRPRLTDEEIVLLEQDRRQRMQKIANLLFDSPEFKSSRYQIEIRITHKKKRYSNTFLSK